MERVWGEGGTSVGRGWDVCWCGGGVMVVCVGGGLVEASLSVVTVVVGACDVCGVCVRCMWCVLHLVRAAGGGSAPR